MVKFMEWLIEGNRVLSLFGLAHWVLGAVQRVFFDNRVEGLLLMIVGVLLVILSKMETDSSRD
jgi:membrane-bound ClpP family serine protease